ncbi:hypothetical protein HNP49_000201 [Pseudomonas fluvialis]|uniref:Secreted protein n=1 Tax=Pseudomonas fluvialis TaxID=1793966 RepID=A0A7X0BPN6_9PSED|nr:hypothetical protein [Pseudomonas fluvialis]MBB6340051.1 hypothetical protein [Pseudomonas fluvialis]
MKKHAIAIALTSLFFAAGASAVDLPQGGVITTAACPTLGEDVTIQTSNGVLAAYACNEAANAAAVSTCHNAGSRKSRVYQCVSTDPGADAQVGTADDSWNNASCPNGDGSTQVAGQFTITADYSGFVVNTRGGGVAGQALGGNCTSGTVGAILPY